MQSINMFGLYFFLTLGNTTILPHHIIRKNCEFLNLKFLDVSFSCNSQSSAILDLGV